MSHFPSEPDIELIGLFKKYSSRGILPLLEYHDAILRNDSELTVAERELIASYVSAINGCRFCFSAHREHARAQGIDAAVFGELEINTEHPSISAKIRAALIFAKKLTLHPHTVDVADAQAIYQVGYSEAGLFDLISVTALYNFMNRVVEGAGIKRYVRNPNISDEMRRKFRYTHLWKQIGPQQS